MALPAYAVGARVGVAVPGEKPDEFGKGYPAAFEAAEGHVPGAADPAGGEIRDPPVRVTVQGVEILAIKSLVLAGLAVNVRGSGKDCLERRQDDNHL